MNLKCKINGKEYELLVQGNTLSDEYNERLDSANIILAHILKIKNLKPYDDVYIYDSNFKFGGYGYYKYEDGKEDYGAVFDSNGNLKPGNVFYKHLLVDNYTEEFVNLRDKIYKYKIALMSEIKKLEKIQCPNISITQPLNSNKKVSVYEYITRYVELYSPKVKKVKNKGSKTWGYENKYKVDPSLEMIFGNVYSPDFSLNAPTLRDILSKLMICKDMIPYVENDVIKAMDITQRKNEINLENIPCTNLVSNMTSNDYCTSLRRNYSEALSQDSTCSSVEYLGFRNSDSALMTLENMRLETRFPIYKINKMYMCYYKKADYKLEDKDYFFLCKQDITPLVKLNTERNALSKDWNDFNKERIPLSIEELAEYKLATLGYDIGSNYITGFGESYEYPKGWWKNDTKTYLENILLILDNLNPFGINSLEEKTSSLSYDEKEKLYFHYKGDIFKKISTPFATKFEHNSIWQIKSALDMKGLFFQIEYQGFFNGSIVHSKNHLSEDIVSNDNSSSSLALLELDGLSQKEKVNRLGNKTYQFTVRYDEYNDLSNLLNLGDYFSYDEEDDIIIYHREIAIYDNYVLVTYFAAKDYVLKNYYTSVYARHRTWNLIPYGESVTRAENRKKFLELSTSKINYEYNLEKENFIENSKFLSCFSSSGEMVALNKWENFNKINFGYIYHLNNKYLTDINAFVSGDSLCFNIKMFDNISMGTYISALSPFEAETFKDKTREWLDVSKDYTGSNTSIYMTVDDEETGTIKELGFYMGHKDSSMEYQKLTNYEDEDSLKETIYSVYEKINVYPKTTENDESIQGYGGIIDVYKDNKEVIDLTYQVETISNDKNILFSTWFMKLNDLVGNHYKNDETYTKTFLMPSSIYDDFCFYNATAKVDKAVENTYPKLIVSFNTNLIDTIKTKLNNQDKINISIESEKIVYRDMNEISPDDVPIEYRHQPMLYYISLIPKRILSFVDNSKVTIEFQQLIKWKIKENEEIKLKENTSIQTFEFEFLEEDYDGTPFNSEYVFFEKSLYDIYRYENDENILFSPIDTVYRLQNNKSGWLENDNTPIFSNKEENLINSSFFIKEDGEFITTRTIEKTINKNMFLVLSSQKLKNTLVYNSYKLNNFPEESVVLTEKKLSDFILPISGQTILFNEELSFNMLDFSKSILGIDEYSLFREINLYNKFVVDKKKEYRHISIRKYPILNSYKVYYLNGTERTLVYDSGFLKESYRKLTYEGWELEDFIYQNSELIERNKGSYISINNSLIKKLQIDLSNNGKENFNVESIQYWFMNDTQENQEDNLLNFVFGVNLTEEDKQKDEIRIYASLVSNRDPKVYDEYHNVVGKVHNYYDDSKNYGEAQYYDEEDI